MFVIMQYFISSSHMEWALMHTAVIKRSSTNSNEKIQLRKSQLYLNSMTPLMLALFRTYKNLTPDPEIEIRDLRARNAFSDKG